MPARTKTYFSILTTALAFVFILITLGSAAAQSTVPSPGTGNGPFAESLERRYREAALRTVGMIKGALPPTTRISQAALKQLNDDLTRVQVVRSTMVTDFAAGRRFEYKRLVRDAGEIKKRVSRIQTTLTLSENSSSDRPRPESVRYDRDKIQDAVSNLCIEISGFLENPMIKSGVYNVRYTADAERSLDAVIRLAANIKNSAQALQRSK
jgi:hypothetical protein